MIFTIYIEGGKQNKIETPCDLCNKTIKLKDGVKETMKKYDHNFTHLVALAHLQKQQQHTNQFAIPKINVAKQMAYPGE